MSWSWRVGQFAGIDLRVHATFLVLLAWVWTSFWLAGKSIDAIVAGAGFIAAVFACFALHEIGHAIAAQRVGIRTSGVMLLPMGSIARLEQIPEEWPKHQFGVALAGPAVNVTIAAILYAWLTLRHGWAPSSPLSVTAGPFVERLFVANLWLALFNLIPALPMDGGRVLRALLVPRVTYPEATQFAAFAGQCLAFVLAFIGLFSHPMLLFAAWFVWIGATQESEAAQTRPALSGTTAQAAMLTGFDELKPSESLADAVRLTLRGPQHDLPVVDQGRVVGILTRTDLLVAVAQYGLELSVTAVMRRRFQLAESTETLDIVFQRLAPCDCHTIPVIDNGRLVGLITMERLGEYLLADAATQKPRASLAKVGRMLWRGERLGMVSQSASGEVQTQ
jgi:Zn-dependent protease/CBS domain-containing protein